MTTPFRSRRDLAVIGSSGGAALAAADRCLRDAGAVPRWLVLTDRTCGLAEWARREKHPTHLVKFDSPEQFSATSADLLGKAGIHDVLLFFTRRISSPLLESFSVWNVHPSLLPAFPGLHAVRQAHRAGVRQIGATLHSVTEEIDRGPIVAQVVAPTMRNGTIESFENLSYLQKVWLVLVWWEHLSGDGGAAATAPPWCANPGLRSQNLQRAFRAMARTQPAASTLGL